MKIQLFPLNANSFYMIPVHIILYEENVSDLLISEDLLSQSSLTVYIIYICRLFQIRRLKKIKNKKRGISPDIRDKSFIYRIRIRTVWIELSCAENILDAYNQVETHLFGTTMIFDAYFHTYMILVNTSCVGY